MQFSTILLPLDIENSQPTAQALALAIELASRHRALLRVMTVVPGFGSPSVSGYFPRVDMALVFANCYERLEALVEPSLAGNDVQVKLRVREGTAHREILKEAERVKADLIVIPSHSHTTAERFFLGSVAARVVERAKTSVLVVRPGEATG